MLNAAKEGATFAVETVVFNTWQPRRLLLIVLALFNSVPPVEVEEVVEVVEVVEASVGGGGGEMRENAHRSWGKVLVVVVVVSVLSSIAMFAGGALRLGSSPPPPRSSINACASSGMWGVDAAAGPYTSSLCSSTMFRSAFCSVE